MKYLTTIVCLCFTLLAYSQDKPNQQVTVTTIDGSTIIGTIETSNSERMVLKTDFGKAEIQMDKIKKVSYEEVESNLPLDLADLGDNNYSASHYLFSSSSYGLQKGESYYENTYLFWNTYAAGLNDYFSVNVSGELISPLFSGNLPVIAVSPKLSLPMENIGAFSLSSTIFSFPNDGNQFGGFINAGLTLGNRQNNISINGAFGWGSEVNLDEINPFSISTMMRLTDKLSLVSENWIFTGDNFTEGAYSVNLRYHFSNNRSSFTFGLWRPTEDTGPVIAIPFASGLIGF